MLNALELHLAPLQTLAKVANAGAVAVSGPGGDWGPRGRGGERAEESRSVTRAASITVDSREPTRLLLITVAVKRI